MGENVVHRISINHVLAFLKRERDWETCLPVTIYLTGKQRALLTRLRKQNGRRGMNQEVVSLFNDGLRYRKLVSEGVIKGVEHPFPWLKKAERTGI